MGFKPFDYLIKFAGGYFNFFAGICSIVSLFLIFAKDKNQLILSLIVFIVFLVICFLRLIWFTSQFLMSKSENGYYKLATIVKYTTSDGKHITHDLQKYIQCKQMIMMEHDHEFYWTGSQEPVIESETMKFEEIRKGDDHYKKAILKFITPLVYNRFFLVHIRMILDDSNGSSKPYINMRVKENTQLITFRVELLHKKRKVPDATLSRSKISANGSDISEFIEMVPFNSKTFSYDCNKYNPEVGYSYKLEWEK